MAKGFHQIQGHDYNETFSPVVKPITIRLILTLTLSWNWTFQQLDVNNAFLNGILDEEVYMQRPPGFEGSDSFLVYKLHKALYGLKQAPRQWFERLKSGLLNLGIQDSKCDPSLFIYNKSNAVVYLLVYVDDIIITGSCNALIHSLIQQLHASFALKQLGKLDYFLGIEVHFQPSGSVLLTQSKYIRDLLVKTNMAEAKPLPSTMISSGKLSKTGSDPLADPSMYRSVVGPLQYATITRPEISFAVNKVCQFMANPLEAHWVAVKRILRYLKGTIHHGLQFLPAPRQHPLYLIAYCDADWAADPDDRRSTSVLPFFWVRTWFPGDPENSQLWLVQAPRLSIAALAKLQQICYSFKRCSRSSVFSFQLLKSSVIIRVLLPWLTTRFSMPAPNTWRLISSLFVRKYSVNNFRFCMSLNMINGQMH